MARPVSTGLVEGPPIQEGYALRQFRSGDEIRYDDLAAIPTPGLSARTSRVSYQCHMNCDEWRQMTTKVKKRLRREGESELAPFDQNLLIPLDLSRLRQIVIKLVSRLLTEGLLVRI